MPRPLKLALPVGVGIAAGGAVAGVAVAIAEYVVRQMTAPSRRRAPLNLGFTPFETGVRFEEVTLTGGHDSPIRGWLLLQPGAPGASPGAPPGLSER